jgi:hypothetical protein
MLVSRIYQKVALVQHPRVVSVTRDTRSNKMGYVDAKLR